MRIWKFPIKVVDKQEVMMPEGAKILAVQVQNGQVCLWSLCDEESPKTSRNIAIYGTGHPVPDKPGEYVGTFQLYGGELVFHAFDLSTDAKEEI